MLRKTMLLCGIIPSVLYATITVVIATLWDGYDWKSQTISELSAIGAPTRSAWVIPAMFYTPLIMAFGYGVRAMEERDLAARQVTETGGTLPPDTSSDADISMSSR